MGSVTYQGIPSYLELLPDDIPGVNTGIYSMEQRAVQQPLLNPPGETTCTFYFHKPMTL